MRRSRSRAEPDDSGKPRKSAYEHAVEALARRARSRAELERWLLDREHEAEAVAAAIDRLVANGYLDDRAFARAFTRTRTEQGHGRRRIAAELARRGVARPIVDEALGELERDRERPEADALLALAERRARGLRALEPAVAQRRLFGWLVRRGHDPRASAEISRRLFSGR